MSSKTLQLAGRNRTGGVALRHNHVGSSGTKLLKDDKPIMQTTSHDDPMTEPVMALRHVAEESMELMRPGDILLLEGTESLRDLVDKAFFAILACPLCGKLDLLTQPQYSGTETVICGYDDCCCHFRINRRREIIYLPVN